MLNVNKFKGAIARAGYTQESLAKEMDMSPNTLNAKVNGNSRITVDEVVKFCEVLSIDNDSEKIEIFLS